MKYIVRWFNRHKEQNVVAAKLGILNICKNCHEKIHGESYRLHQDQDGFLTEEDGDDFWVHDKNGKTTCGGMLKHRNYAELMRTDQ